MIPTNKKTRLGAILGNILSHYDTSLFGWTAPFLAPALFPGQSGIDALILTFALLPISYIARPFGALFWGWIGDAFGRKTALSASLIGMAGATFAIGCLPLSSFAWVFLALCRALQGFCAAGEEKGAALYLLEHTEKEKRPFASAFYDASGIAGIFLASLLAALFGLEHWRELYFLGGAAGAIGFFLRRAGVESPGFTPAKASWSVLWQERKAIAAIALVSGFSYANYYLITIFMNGFLPTVTALKKEEMLAFNTHLLWIDFVLLLAFGALCRKIAKEKLMAAAALSAAALAIPLFSCLDGASWSAAAAVRLSLVALGTALAAPYHVWKMEILPDRHRFFIGSVGSALGSKLFGAPMPALAAWCVMKTGSIWTAALPIVATGIAAGALLLLLPQRVAYLRRDGV